MNRSPSFRRWRVATWFSGAATSVAVVAWLVSCGSLVRWDRTDGRVSCGLSAGCAWAVVWRSSPPADAFDPGFTIERSSRRLEWRPRHIDMGTWSSVHAPLWIFVSAAAACFGVAKWRAGRGISVAA